MYEVFWLYVPSLIVWLDYSAAMAGKCCALKKTAFLATQPAYFRQTQQRTCLCGMCGAAHEATAEMIDLYPVEYGTLDFINVYHRLFAGGKPSVQFHLCYLQHAFELPK